MARSALRITCCPPLPLCFLPLEELQVPPRQRGFQVTDVGMPFGLDRFHGADELFEGVQSPVPLHQRQSLFPMLWGLKDEVCEGPPVEVIQVEVTVQAGAAVVGDDAAQGDHTAVAKVLCQVRTGGRSEEHT